ncbi:MAG: hypothetical protein LBR13_01310 [Dysgonamonadaceae bacterium]|jgi:hypothetical protein|nr:hypothetical protein [Dysgonamonadaceae bacterium]
MLTKRFFLTTSLLIIIFAASSEIFGIIPPSEATRQRNAEPPSYSYRASKNHYNNYEIVREGTSTYHSSYKENELSGSYFCTSCNAWVVPTADGKHCSVCNSELKNDGIKETKNSPVGDCWPALIICSIGYALFLWKREKRKIFMKS